jgi:hypothetical protein
MQSKAARFHFRENWLKLKRTRKKVFCLGNFVVLDQLQGWFWVSFGFSGERYSGAFPNLLIFKKLKTNDLRVYLVFREESS